VFAVRPSLPTQAKDLQVQMRQGLTRKLTQRRNEEERQVRSYTTVHKLMGQALPELRPAPKKPTAPVPSFARNSSFTEANQVYARP
jgi:hypothetical protein